MTEEKGEKKVQKATAAREEVKTVLDGVECAMEVGSATISAHASSEEACASFQEGWAEIGREMGMGTKAVSNHPSPSPTGKNSSGPG